MHRLIMTSTTYRQSSRVSAELDTLDPENRYLARMPMRRMDAEEVYDTILYVSGLLDETRFGPPDPVEVRRDGLVTPLPAPRGYRRSVYVRQRRSQMPTLLETFDLPQMNPNCVARPTSTVAAQALHLLNNGKVRERAEAFANKVRQSAGNDSLAQIDWIYLTALSRPPTQEEREIGANALKEFQEIWLNHGTLSREQASQKALAAYCHTILNSAAFLYID
ncbi:MAG: hypothetical protein KatS3mg105_4289 [Gemmatales bacterium]|nr:MAG: hypothetical protein KatS3mg105_4289 [Gemmatales bacterium]